MKAILIDAIAVLSLGCSAGPEPEEVKTDPNKPGGLTVDGLATAPTLGGGQAGGGKAPTASPGTPMNGDL